MICTSNLMKVDVDKRQKRDLKKENVDKAGARTHKHVMSLHCIES
jgi:hypothetical protein